MKTRRLAGFDVLRYDESIPERLLFRGLTLCVMGSVVEV